MTITLIVPDLVAQRIVDALAFDYQATLDNGTPNPLTRAQYAKYQIIQFMKNKVRLVEQETAIRNLTQSIENDITIT